MRAHRHSPCIHGKITHDFFKRRLSMVGLARKYGRTVEQIEAVIRKETRKA